MITFFYCYGIFRNLWGFRFRINSRNYWKKSRCFAKYSWLSLRNKYVQKSLTIWFSTIWFFWSAGSVSRAEDKVVQTGASYFQRELLPFEEDRKWFEREPWWQSPWEEALYWQQHLRWGWEGEWQQQDQVIITQSRRVVFPQETLTGACRSSFSFVIFNTFTYGRSWNLTQPIREGQVFLNLEDAQTPFSSLH